VYLTPFPQGLWMEDSSTKPVSVLESMDGTGPGWATYSSLDALAEASGEQVPGPKS